MLMLKISDVKLMMKKLLFDSETDFDSFLLLEASVRMGMTFHIDGHINRDFYSQEELDVLKSEALAAGLEYDEALSRWADVKSHVLSIIKGHKTPLSFTILLQLSKENTANFMSGLSLPVGSIMPDKLILRFRFENGMLTAVTGTSYPSFTMDKTPDVEWDKYIRRFFDSLSIPYEELS